MTWAHVESVTVQDGKAVVTGEGPVLAHVGAALVSNGLEPADLRLLMDLQLPRMDGMFAVARRLLGVK